MLLNVTVLGTGEKLDVEFKKYPSAGDIGVIHKPDGTTIRCEAAMVPANREPDEDEAPIGISVIILED